ncbi:1659_t:CDS:2 [Entrophospora sp. SA101]|nr:1659_t:CDS:2 [Entrophospora sp. SA101]
MDDLFTKEEWEWTNTENLEDSEVPDDATDLNSYTTEDVRNTLEPFLKGNENCDPILHYDYEWRSAGPITIRTGPEGSWPKGHDP